MNDQITWRFLFINAVWKDLQKAWDDKKHKLSYQYLLVETQDSNASRMQHVENGSLILSFIENTKAKILKMHMFVHPVDKFCTTVRGFPYIVSIDKQDTSVCPWGRL